MSDPYPVIDLPFAGRTSADWCSLRTRSVIAVMGYYTGDASAWYAAAKSAVQAYDFGTIPWGQCFYMDYGGGTAPGSRTPDGTHIDSPISVTDGRVNLSWGFFIGGQDTSPPSLSGTNVFFLLQKTQFIVPKPWFISYQDANSSGFYSGGPTFLTYDSLTNPSYDSNYPTPPTSGNVTFCDPASRLVTLPVPNFKGKYILNPSQNLRPAGAHYDGSGNLYVTGFVGSWDISGLPAGQPSYYWLKGINDLTAPGLSATGYFIASPDGGGGITFTGTPGSRVTFFTYYANPG